MSSFVWRTAIALILGFCLDLLLGDPIFCTIPSGLLEISLHGRKNGFGNVFPKHPAENWQEER